MFGRAKESKVSQISQTRLPTLKPTELKRAGKKDKSIFKRLQNAHNERIKPRLPAFQPNERQQSLPPVEKQSYEQPGQNLIRTELTQKASPEDTLMEAPEHIEQPAREISPDESTDKATWRSWLERNHKEFAGNFENAGILLAALSEGKNYIHEKFTKRRLPTTNPVTKITPRNDFVAGELLGTVIEISRPELEKFSTYDIQATYRLTQRDGSTFFVGRILDLFKLIGVEERHHTVREHRKPLQDALYRFGINTTQLSLPEYDAIEAEYRALIWQLRYAKEVHMPEATINVLQNRLIAAQEIRAKRKK